MWFRSGLILPPCPLRAASLAPFVLILSLGASAYGQTTAAEAKETRQERVRQLQERRWEVRAVRVDAPPTIDGRLDDAAWNAAEVVSDFYQRERRGEGLPATERTEVRVVYDRTHLYVGFKCFDSQPELVQARGIFRDESGGADDLVSIMIDAYHGHRSGIQFATNLNGLMEDLLQTGESEGTRNANFDTVWFSRGRRTPTGYEVEVMVPFKSLRFEPPASREPVTFGIGFKRNIPRKNEEVIWPFVSNDSSWYRPAELGHLTDLHDIRPGRNFEFRPYALGGAFRDYAGRAGDVDMKRNVGLDAKWGVTTGLTADFTVNTDFAQEEADIQQINFTRFSLFFPEKRQLFLEGQQMFQFGLPREVDLVFTRRIGLSPAGEIAPLRTGARLSGRQGRTSVGAMNMQTGRFGPLAAENFSVLRVKRDLLNRSSVGALFTNRQGGGRDNRVYGADASLLFKRIWSAEGFVARMDETGAAEPQYAAHARFGYSSDRVGFSYRYVDVDQDFRPGVGFVRRRDSRTHSSELRYDPRPRSDLVRQFHLSSAFDYITDQHNALETREREASFGTEFESGDAATVSYANRFEFIDAPFRLRTDVIIPPGAYRENHLTTRLDTFRRRHRTINLSYSTGDFWSGNRDTFSVRANYRLSTKFGLSGNYEVNWVDLPQGRFTTHLVSSRIQIAFRNDIALLSLLQYNHDSRQLSTNIRFNWIPRPGSDLFVVYNELDDRTTGFAVRNRSIVVKLNYLFAL